MNETQKDERLLGVSMTGWRDLVDLMGWETGSKECIEFLTKVREWANDEATLYSEILGVPRPLLVTCIKPEGTSSKIFGCSDGLHWAWDKYIKRGVEITAKDALAQTLMDQGVPAYPCSYDFNINADLIAFFHSELTSEKTYLLKNWGDLTIWEKIKYFESLTKEQQRIVLNSSNTVILQFPIMSPTTKSCADVSAIEQLENMKMFSQYYTDHMPSCTVTVKDHEWDDVVKWVYDNWEYFTNVSFMPYYDSNYPLLPNQSIEAEEYNQRFMDMPKYIDYDLLNKYERLLDDPDDVDVSNIGGCSTGLCPVR